MRMAVKLPRAPPGLVPDSHSIVAERNRLLANVDLGDFLHLNELSLDFTIHTVMIPQSEVMARARRVSPKHSTRNQRALSPHSK